MLRFALSVFLFLKFRTGVRDKLKLNNFDISFLVTLFSIVLIMGYFKLLNSYIEQCIFWAFGRYSTAPELSKSLLIDFFWIPIIASVFLVMLFLVGFSGKSKSFIGKSFPLLLILLVALTSVVASRFTRTGE